MWGGGGGLRFLKKTLGDYYYLGILIFLKVYRNLLLSDSNGRELFTYLSLIQRKGYSRKRQADFLTLPTSSIDLVQKEKFPDVNKKKKSKSGKKKNHVPNTDCCSLLIRKSSLILSLTAETQSYGFI